MPTQQIWVHGNSGALEVVKGWGSWRPTGLGVFLEGKVTEAADDPLRPWVHLHIPMTSLYLEQKGDPPKLRRVMVLISTDCDPAGKSGSVQTAHGYEYRHWDAGGALVQEVQVYDAWRQVHERPGLAWQSMDLNTPAIHEVLIQPEVPIEYGLGVSIRLWFKNQYLIGRAEVYDQQDKGPAGPTEWLSKPELNRDNATKMKSAYVHAVGCEVVPAGS